MCLDTAIVCTRPRRAQSTGSPAKETAGAFAAAVSLPLAKEEEPPSDFVERLCPPFSLHLHKLPDPLFGHAHCSRERNFGKIMGVERRDDIVIRSRYRPLRLHHFYVVGHAGGETISRLVQGSVRQNQIIPRDRYLLRR